MKYYVTFGPNHVHPITGMFLKNYFIEINKSSFSDAWQETVRRFGRKWQDLVTKKPETTELIGRDAMGMEL